MENISENAKGKRDRERMKSLSLGMASKISQLLVENGFGEKSLDIVEALIFAMFIVADTYALAKSEKDQAIEAIHGFYDDMQSYFINKVIIADHKISDTSEIQSISDKFYNLSRNRFTQYGEKFKYDIADSMGSKCSTTVNFLLDNLFIDPLTKEEKLQLMGSVSDKILFFWAGCVQNFRE